MFGLGPVEPMGERVAGDFLPFPIEWVVEAPMEVTVWVGWGMGGV